MNRKLKGVILWGVLLCTFAFEAYAQDGDRPVSMTVPANYSYNANEEIRCYVNKSTVKKGSRATIQVFAMNDARHIPMQLQYKKGALPMRLFALARNTTQHFAFRANLKDILYTKQGASPYSWTWRGRAKAPASPIVAAEKVNSIKWWTVLIVDKKTYTSDTLTTTLQ